MYVNLSKKFITRYLLVHLAPVQTKRKTKVPLWRVINAIIYRLKTGCQWRELPMPIFCNKVLIIWQTVYYYFNKWSKAGAWKQIWNQLLVKNLSALDLSSIALDGSHTPCKRGGQEVGYQARKKQRQLIFCF